MSAEHMRTLHGCLILKLPGDVISGNIDDSDQQSPCFQVSSRHACHNPRGGLVLEESRDGVNVSRLWVFSLLAQVGFQSTRLHTFNINR